MTTLPLTPTVSAVRALRLEAITHIERSLVTMCEQALEDLAEDRSCCDSPTLQRVASIIEDRNITGGVTLYSVSSTWGDNHRWLISGVTPEVALATAEGQIREAAATGGEDQSVLGWHHLAIAEPSGKEVASSWIVVD